MEEFERGKCDEGCLDWKTSKGGGVKDVICVTRQRGWIRCGFGNDTRKMHIRLWLWMEVCEGKNLYLIEMSFVLEGWIIMLKLVYQVVQL